MADKDLTQLRARLVSLREQRNRMVHRSSDIERSAAAAVQSARERVNGLRSELAKVAHDITVMKPEVAAFERGQPPAGDEAGWRTAWRTASGVLAQAEARQAQMRAEAEAAEQRLQQALSAQEAVSADHARTLARLEQEVDELTREVGRLQAEQPPVEAADPRLREVLLDRLQLLESERGWISEEVAVREERLRRIGSEVVQVRALLDLHTPEWGRAALDSLAPEAAPDRPAWKQGVLEILAAASLPLHYREIAEQLAATGRSLGGQDPAETLLAALGRDPDFVRVGRGLYWLSSRRLDGNYPRRLREARQAREAGDARG